MISSASRSLLVPLAHGREAPPDDVLVQPLAGADAQREAAVRHERERRRGLRDDRRVVAHRRARDSGGQPDACRCSPAIAPSTVHANGEWPCDVEPRVVVVADLDEVEAGCLRQLRLAHELLGSEPLRRELVPVLHASPFDRGDATRRGHMGGRRLRRLGSGVTMRDAAVAPGSGLRALAARGTPTTGGGTPTTGARVIRLGSLVGKGLLHGEPPT